MTPLSCSEHAQRSITRYRRVKCGVIYFETNFLKLCFCSDTYNVLYERELKIYRGVET